VSEPVFVSTYRWLDTFGRMRMVDIFRTDPVTREIRVYAIGEDDAQVLVAAVDADGKFTRLVHTETVKYGFDTAAAWNNLIDLCRMAHGSTNIY